MNRIFCSVDERYVNPLFEVFDGGDFVLSSYRDIEEDFTRIQIFFEKAEDEDDARRRLSDALKIVGIAPEISFDTIPDEDWKLSYRRHFKTEHIGKRLWVRPPWEPEVEGDVVITLDPGLAFGTGKHETTRACLEYIEELAESGKSMLDMGSGSGILSIAAAKLGYSPVFGFDVDQEAVDASKENAALNHADAKYVKFALGRKASSKLQALFPAGPYDLVVANILGPLLIRFANEIEPYVGKNLVISGILTELYPDVLAAYVKLGFEEVSRKTFGEWTSGLLTRNRKI